MQMQRGFIGIGLLMAIILGVIVLGGGAYFVMQQTPSQTASENYPNISTQQQTQAQGQTTDVPTQTTPTQPSGTSSTWQTYRSSYGFQIQYPQGWKIVSETGDGKAGYPGWVVFFGTGTFGNEG